MTTPLQHVAQETAEIRRLSRHRKTHSTRRRRWILAAAEEGKTYKEIAAAMDNSAVSLVGKELTAARADAEARG